MTTSVVVLGVIVVALLVLGGWILYGEWRRGSDWGPKR
jgi:hypothetical protein